MRRPGIFMALAVVSMGVWLGCAERQEQTPPELSGVAYVGDVEKGRVLVVSDERNHVFYSYEMSSMIPVLDSVWTFPSEGFVHDLLEYEGQEAKDCESIKVFEDKVLVLSENRRQVFGPRGLFASYDEIDALRETEDGVGLEGFAIREAGENWVLAALWEGGQESGVLPRLCVFETRGGFVRTEAIKDTSVELQWPEIETLSALPRSAIRASDLVVYAEGEWLVILSEWKGEKRKWLQRFGDDGRAIGKPMLLRAPEDEDGLLPDDFARLNWEGLCWLDRGRSELLLVHDAETKEPFLWKVRFDPSSD